MIKPRSWKNTLNLPKTTFPPRLPIGTAERATILRKCTEDLYAWQQENRKGHAFTLHDGPPYANGDLHIGHALNKILKDITSRFHLSQGRRVNYTPGWDCHGLPIELKALGGQLIKTEHEERQNVSLRRKERPTASIVQNVAQALGLRKYRSHETEAEREENAARATATALAVRKAARNLASSTVERQMKQFKQWGIMGDWSNTWKTMNKDYELKQLRVFGKMVSKGLIYRQFKPVYWSPSSKTALAEAELEYKDDHVSTAVFIKYPLWSLPSDLKLKLGEHHSGMSCVIWTTMPWTLPANKAIGFNPAVQYAIVESQKHGRLLIACNRVEEVGKQCGEILRPFTVVDGSALTGVTYLDQLWTRGRLVTKNLIPADHVTADSGSGLAHLAPGHGSDDYSVCLKHGITPFAPVDKDGMFTQEACPDYPTLLAGKHVMSEGNVIALNHIRKTHVILAQHEYMHKYPYDWRSKEPVIFRATEQWFANVGEIRERALKCLEDVKFIPQNGRSRLESFVQNRSEWCISRQRAWGVPIPALFHKDSSEVLLTAQTVDHIISVIKERGIDSWWSDDVSDPAWTPSEMRNADDSSQYRRGTDTMDVWFDSGTSWTQTASGIKPTDHAADVYLEGSDQHRGWFQSSLLTYIADQSANDTATDLQQYQAPFRALVTHGFVLDQQARKMSKSIGNVVSPMQIIDGSLLPPLRRKFHGSGQTQDMGPDALRIWVASCDFTKDAILSVEKLKINNSTLVKLRITFKQLLGILDDFDPLESMRQEQFSKNHKMAIWHLEMMATAVKDHYRAYEYHKAMDEITRYVNVDLSAFYMETIKDAAYCGTGEERQMVQYTILIILRVLQQVLAPITPLLVQETWDHLQARLKAFMGLSPLEDTWSSKITQVSGLLTAHERHSMGKETSCLSEVLSTVQKAQERARSDKMMGSSLESYVTLEVPATHADSGDETTASFLLRNERDLANLFVVSKVTITPEAPSFVEGDWHYVEEIELMNQRVIVHVHAPQEQKCCRCWRYIAPVMQESEEALCTRCEAWRG
ncbi:uncharacterized protein KY384_001806 [Bacidia gigantensis]|uniref:uncharacterized protein n=1 Tax=Bacidia gigantensis TaxID=2732470 RepID=UPI001D04759B|nr:uncharacterized protein KY384_001806 [Bacidia gigantensis]KAG8533023.1 hypothetical protein KY384_001806 [Bacidia gigantensis]